MEGDEGAGGPDAEEEGGRTVALLEGAAAGALPGADEAVLGELEGEAVAVRKNLIAVKPAGLPGVGAPPAAGGAEAADQGALRGRGLSEFRGLAGPAAGCPAGTPYRGAEGHALRAPSPMVMFRWSIPAPTRYREPSGLHDGEHRQEVARAQGGKEAEGRRAEGGGAVVAGHRGPLPPLPPPAVRGPAGDPAPARRGEEEAAPPAEGALGQAAQGPAVAEPSPGPAAEPPEPLADREPGPAPAGVGQPYGEEGKRAGQHPPGYTGGS